MAEEPLLSRRDLLSGRVASGSPQPELHLSSLLIHAKPGGEDAVAQALLRVPGLEIHARSGGKIVVTLETRSEQEVVMALGAISDLPGVLSAALVYHHFESSSQAT